MDAKRLCEKGCDEPVHRNGLCADCWHKAQDDARGDTICDEYEILRAVREHGIC